LAEALLLGKHYEESARAFAALLERSRQRQDLWNRFLTAAAASPVLGKSEQAMLDWIHEQRGRRKDMEFWKHLVDAEARHGTPEGAVSLMQTLLERSPRDADLRLRLADALYKLKRFDEADAQYRWLLAETEPQAGLKTPSAVPVAPRQ
jgi:Flp pilus assembly protein TadD